MEAYFDNSATTPVYPEVRDLVVKLMEQDYGNPSSLHQKGVDAARYVSDARDKIARSPRFRRRRSCSHREEQNPTTWL